MEMALDMWAELLGQLWASSFVVVKASNIVKIILVAKNKKNSQDVKSYFFCLTICIIMFDMVLTFVKNTQWNFEMR